MKNCYINWYQNGIIMAKQRMIAKSENAFNIELETGQIIDF